MYAIKSMDTPRAGEERHSPHLRQDREDLGADGGGGADCLSIDNEASLTEAKLAIGDRAPLYNKSNNRAAPRPSVEAGRRCCNANYD